MKTTGFWDEKGLVLIYTPIGNETDASDELCYGHLTLGVCVCMMRNWYMLMECKQFVYMATHFVVVVSNQMFYTMVS